MHGSSQQLNYYNRLTMEAEPYIRYNIDTSEYENNFILKQVLRPQYGTLFKHQGFLVQGLYRILDLPKKMDLLLDSSTPLNFDNWGRLEMRNITFPLK